MGLCGVGEASLRGFEVLGFLCFWVFLSLAKTLCMNAGPPPFLGKRQGMTRKAVGASLCCVSFGLLVQSL